MWALIFPGFVRAGENRKLFTGRQQSQPSHGHQWALEISLAFHAHRCIYTAWHVGRYKFWLINHSMYMSRCTACQLWHHCNPIPIGAITASPGMEHCHRGISKSQR